MPELIEVEAYRHLAEARALDRRIVAVDAPDGWYLKGGLDAATLQAALVGRRFIAARRRGKLLMLDVAGGPTLGLRFGMTGRLAVDGLFGVGRLQYGSYRDEPGWVRFRVTFSRGGSLVLLDPRRLGGVLLDPDESLLGPDASTVGPAELARILATSDVALKARLMDQSKLAGVGNLIADETLFRAGLDPARPARSLSPVEVRRLHRVLRRTISELTDRGGSHTGDLQVARVRGSVCPRDGAPLLRREIGGRTTYSCPMHQR